MANRGMIQPAIMKRMVRKSDMPNLIPNADKDGQKRVRATIFELVGGNVNNTEVGEIDNNYNPTSFQTYQKLFTGKDNLLAVWRESTSAVLENDTDLQLVKQFQVGKFWEGVQVQQTNNKQYSQSSQDTQFIQQTIEQNITLYFEGKELKYENYFDLFVLIDRSTQFMDIQAATIYIDQMTGEVLGTEISFTSLNDKLANTGAAVNQFVQLGAAGEGAAFPAIGDNGAIIIDPFKIKNIGVDEVQIEIFCGAALTALTIFGRRTQLDDNKITAPILLQPHQMQTPIPSKITSTIGGENNYYFVEQAQPEINIFYDDWKTKIRSQYDFNAKPAYEGVIQTEKVDVEATNPKDNESTGTKRKDLWDNTWFFATTQKEVPVGAVPFITDDFTFPATMNAAIALGFSNLLYLDTQKLPIDLNTSTTFSFQSLPLIGGYANNLFLGIPIGWNNQTTRIDAKPISFFIPTTLYDFGSNAFNQDGKLPLDLFRKDTPDSSSALLGNGNITTILKFSLTDRYSVIRGGTRTIRNTKDLAQANNPDGTPRAEVELIDNSYQPENPALGNGEAFIIDFANLKVQAKGDYKITFFNKGNPVWQGIYQTRAKMTGSIREWENNLKMSFWKEANGKQVSYPQAYLEKLPQTPFPFINVDLNRRVATSIWHPTTTTGGTKTNPPHNPQIQPIEIDLASFGINVAELQSNYKSIKLIWDAKLDFEGQPPFSISTTTETYDLDLSSEKSLLNVSKAIYIGNEQVPFVACGIQVAALMRINYTIQALANLLALDTTKIRLNQIIQGGSIFDINGNQPNDITIQSTCGDAYARANLPTDISFTIRQIQFIPK